MAASGAAKVIPAGVPGWGQEGGLHGRQPLAHDSARGGGESAACLARAGLRVLVCERRHIVGGPCAEYEYFPGYRASITSPGRICARSPTATG